MGASKLKHPLKERLDEAEGVALEIGAALEQIGVGVGETLWECEVYIYRSDLPATGPLEVEWHYVAEHNDYAHAALEIVFRDGNSKDGESIFRFGWTEDDGYYVELDQDGSRTPLHPDALAFAEPFGLKERGDRKLVPVDGQGDALALVMERLRARLSA